MWMMVLAALLQFWMMIHWTHCLTNKRLKQGIKVCESSMESISGKDKNNQSYDSIQVQIESKIQAVTFSTSES